MAKVEDLSDPVRNGGIEFVQLARKEMIHAFNNDQMILAGE
jgi:hypothetical protein